MKMLTGIPARILTVVLLAQAATYYAVASRTEITPESGKKTMPVPDPWSACIKRPAGRVTTSAA